VDNQVRGQQSPGGFACFNKKATYLSHILYGFCELFDNLLLFIPACSTNPM